MPTRIRSYRHNPTHIYENGVYYFITGTVLYHVHILAQASYKEYLQQQLLSLAPSYGLDLKAWVVLNNHYHILFHLEKGENLSRFLQRFHAKTATTFNKWDNLSGRQVWWNY
ncbi:MAG: hypothetical protein BroJett011_55800 [Chloroflexota bacterium]|nr:MAG: hypothetical protein BroJett011_55800 [Chloroflexota bacterium]